MNTATIDKVSGADVGPSWKEVLRAMHVRQAQTWTESAAFWRGEAAKHLLAGNAVMAGEALLNANVREEYAAEDLRLAAEFAGELLPEGGGHAPGARAFAA